MDDMEALLDTFDDLPVEALEQVLAYMRQNRQVLQRQLSQNDDAESRIIKLGRALDAVRRDFEQQNPDVVDPDQVYFQQRLAQLLERLGGDQR